MLCGGRLGETSGFGASSADVLGEITDVSLKQKSRSWSTDEIPYLNLPQLVVIGVIFVH